MISIKGKSPPIKKAGIIKRKEVLV